ncbi:MAG: pyruvate, phosphate dikinase, partial [Fibrobacter sp.]|nr:pyruvate, phosphate dikinase [Fibrobacter sp.]
DETVEGLIEKTGNPRFAYDAYRRLIMMYADVVMEKAAGLVPHDGKGIRKVLDERLGEVKKEKGYVADTDLTEDDLKELVKEFKGTVLEVLGVPFPEDPQDQLWGAIGAVFMSWNGKRAVDYRRIEKIPDEWGTAVNVQAMVFGNMGDTSATGVAFTRNPGTGDKHFYGEYLVNAQGEDVVAGIRTPGPINDYSRNDQSKDIPTLQEIMPEIYKELFDIQKRLEKHYNDMQDIEFTIEEGVLYMLQCRVGKRNGVAAVKMAADMVKERLITPEVAVQRVIPEQLIELLLPRIDPEIEAATEPIAKGLPAGPGGARGRVVFNSEDAVEWASRGEHVILVREETSPEDVDGMHKADAILTSKGGMTSHAALVARGWGKCCVVGCSDIEVGNKSFIAKNGEVINEGDWISLNGTSGLVYLGKLDLVEVDLDSNESYKSLMKMCDKLRTLKIRTNADNPLDAQKAMKFGAEGIGLFRTEHMFYGEGSEVPLFLLRKMIMSPTLEDRKSVLAELAEFVKKDIKATMEVLNGFPITIRLLDPPLHEFVPHSQDKIDAMAEELKIDVDEVRKRGESLKENNPMLGHRGVRLGVTYPEISEMQIRAIFEAAGELIMEKKKAFPEIMIPVTGVDKELKNQKKIVERIYSEVIKNLGISKIPYSFGTMIEIPRAALTADKMANVAQFFSFGTNDLTQMGFGFSRDDIGSFLPAYLLSKILPDDPFKTIDQEGIGELIRIGIERGRSVKPDLKIGICGEHGGDAESVKFCYRSGMNYVSCSPFRIPIARLAAAQAVAEELVAQTKKQQKTEKPQVAKKSKTVSKKKTVSVKKVSAAAKKKTAAVKKAVKKTVSKKTATVKKAAKKTVSKKVTAVKKAVRKTTARKKR